MSSRKELANAIRALSMDAVQKANSGHPGAPMGMADIAEVLWNDYLKHNPANPDWADRDRFGDDPPHVLDGDERRVLLAVAADPGSEEHRVLERDGTDRHTYSRLRLLCHLGAKPRAADPT